MPGRPLFFVKPTLRKTPTVTHAVAYLKILIKEFESYYPEVEILRINHDVDHIHILASIPPKISVGKVIGILKANTSSKIRNKYEFIRKAYYGGGSIWSGGYLYQQ